MERRLLCRFTALLTVACLAGTAGRAFPEKPLVRSLMASAVFVRETKDQEWHIRVVGSLPCGPGIYVVVFNAQKKMVFHGEIPFGTYAETKPFLLTVPADGVTGDYAIKLVGQQDDIMGLVLPLTDLHHEVYDGTGTALGYAPAGQARLVAFKVPEGQTQIQATGGRGNFRILKADGSVLIDSKTAAIPADSPEKHWKKDELEIRAQVAPGQTYWFDPYEIFYFGFKDPVYLTFDPDLWFAPTFSLGDVKWWKGIAR